LPQNRVNIARKTTNESAKYMLQRYVTLPQRNSTKSNSWHGGSSLRIPDPRNNYRRLANFKSQMFTLILTSPVAYWMRKWAGC